MSEIFQRTRIVEARHIDLLGHVNNQVWVDWVLQLAEAHSTEKGFDFETNRARGGIWIVRRQELDYLKPAFEGDALLEETWVSEMKGARSIRLSRISRPKDDAELFRATTHWAFVDAITHRPKRIDRELQKSFAGT